MPLHATATAGCLVVRMVKPSRLFAGQLVLPVCFEELLLGAGRGFAYLREAEVTTLFVESAGMQQQRGVLVPGVLMLLVVRRLPLLRLKVRVPRSVKRKNVIRCRPTVAEL